MALCLTLQAGRFGTTVTEKTLCLWLTEACCHLERQLHEMTLCLVGDNYSKLIPQWHQMTLCLVGDNHSQLIPQWHQMTSCLVGDIYNQLIPQWHQMTLSCRWQSQQTDTTVTPNDIVSCRMTNATTWNQTEKNHMADRLPSGTVQHKMTQYWAGWQMTPYPSTKFTRQSVLGKILMCHISWHIQLPHIMLTHKDTLQHHTDTQGHLTLLHKHTPNTHPTQKLVLDGVLKESAS